MSKRRTRSRSTRRPSRTGIAALPILLAVACAVAGAGWWLVTRPERRPPPPRNVLLITIDTLRADALGAYGNASAATPWLDRLAAGGVRFTTARAHNVLTLPSHASILAGRLPPDHGVRDNAGFRLAPGEATLATRLAGTRVCHRRLHQRFPPGLPLWFVSGIRRLRRCVRRCGGAPGVSRAGARRDQDRRGGAPLAAGAQGRRQTVVWLAPSLRAALSVRAAGALCDAILA